MIHKVKTAQYNYNYKAITYPAQILANSFLSSASSSSSLHPFLFANLRSYSSACRAGTSPFNTAAISIGVMLYLSPTVGMEISGSPGNLLLCLSRHGHTMLLVNKRVVDVDARRKRDRSLRYRRAEVVQQSRPRRVGPIRVDKDRDWYLALSSEEIGK
jgi:hypothetical protein